mmetsp:Transcript_4826/g.4572  ORF Transcript_4826/g.4572 Transcript_4826/m.4572 type:complete len:190 (+) Transcript_4826:98-667(+)
MIADQLIQRIEYLHSRFFIHRDVKPDNFLVGRTNETRQYLYMIDYGLAKRYRDPKTLEHIPYRNDKNLTGTVRYASTHTHNGIEQARRDDLESLGFILVYFFNGSLPWQGIKAQTKKEKYEKIKESKTSTTSASLCEGLPEEFETYFDTVRDLSFEERPDYTLLRNLFKQVMRNKDYEYDFIFDWMVPS